MRSFVTALALFFAAAVAVEGLASAEDACCSVAGCERDAAAADASDDAAGASDDCPPGCDDGCACCARPAAATMAGTTVPSALVVRTIAYADEADLAPRAPDPRDRDFVPRRAASAT